MMAVSFMLQEIVAYHFILDYIIYYFLLLFTLKEMKIKNVSSSASLSSLLIWNVIFFRVMEIVENEK